MKKAAIEPNGRIEGPVLVHEQVRELVLEDLRVLRRGEITPKGLAGLADRAGNSADDLPHARFADLRITAEACLAEVLGHDDIRGEL
jgi:hypothetical protein